MFSIYGSVGRLLQSCWERRPGNGPSWRTRIQSEAVLMSLLVALLITFTGLHQTRRADLPALPCANADWSVSSEQGSSQTEMQYAAKERPSAAKRPFERVGMATRRGT